MIMPPDGYNMQIIIVLKYRKSFALLTLRALEVYRHEGTQITLGVLVGIEVTGETANGQIVNRSDIFLIGRILTLAGYPHRVKLN